MKNKVVKALACTMSVCMLSASLAGCGNDDGNQSSQGSQGSSDTQQSSQGSSDTQQSSEGSDAQTPDESQTGGIDKSNGLFPAYDFGGVELTLLDQNDLGGHNPDAEGLEENVKAERQEWKDYIEQKYNVKLTFVPLPTGDWKEIRSEIVAAYNSGNPIADVMDAYFQFIGAYVANDMLYDFTDDFANSNTFNRDEYFNWKNRHWGIARKIGGEGLYYNMEWVQRLGMEKTPAEMFDEGRWSYDDCYNYLLDMKSKLGADEYPLFVSPSYWMLFAPAANGTIILNPDGNLNYNQDAFIEAMEFFQKCLDAGLMAVADKDENGDYNSWNYPSDTYGQQNTVVMTHRAAWQADGDKNNFQIGFVPYPWGSNVTIDESKVGEPGAYLTLSENYQSTAFDGQLICFLKNITDKVENPMELMSMMLEFMTWDSSMVAYVPEDEGKINCGWLEDGLDKNLYGYSLSIERLEPYNTLKLGLQMHSNIESILYDGGSIRSSMESYYNADMKTMIDNGYADESVVDDTYVEPEPEAENETE